jgi:hypothetical protein
MGHRSFASRRCAASLLAACALLAAPASHASGTPEVQYDRGGLTVRADRVPLDEVLASIADETGLTIDGEPIDRRDVSKSFEDVPLGQALKRVIGRQNFILWYDADGSPSRLELLGAPLPPPTPRKTAPAPATTALQQLVAYAPVPVPPDVARAFGAARLPMRRVLEGLRHADPAVRRGAAQAVMSAIEANPALLATMRSLTIPQLAQLASSQAGPRVLEVTALLYAASHDPALRRRLSLVLSSLRVPHR